MRGMAAKQDYYEVLGVPRDADDATIKGAFRRLARELHPDVNPDPKAGERFRGVAEAYEVLSDGERRARYDRFGHAGLGGAGGAPTWASSGIGDLFSMLFGEDLFGGGRGGGPAPGGDALIGLEITLPEAAIGVSRALDLELDVACGRCGATGAEPGTHVGTCPQCDGRGEVQQVVRSVLGQMARILTCPQCNGRGQVVTVPCVECRGRGRHPGVRTVEVEIPAGIADGQRVRLRGRAHAGDAGAPDGDLYVAVSVASIEGLERDGLDLVTRVEVEMTEAALGVPVEIPTLTGGRMIDLPPGTQPGEVITLRGEGMPEVQGPRRGNLRVHVAVRVPTRLSDEQRQKLADLDASLGPENYSTDDGLLKRLRRSRRGR